MMLQLLLLLLLLVNSDGLVITRLLVDCGVFVQHLYGVFRVTNAEREPRRLGLPRVHLRHKHAQCSPQTPLRRLIVV